MAFDVTGLGSIADLAKGLVDRFLPSAATEAEKMAAQVQVQQVLEARESAVLDTQKAVMTAELQQGDNFTKRARPSPMTDMPDIKLPPQFWMTWGGVCSVWILGRSAERRGATGKIVSMITGSK